MRKVEIKSDAPTGDVLLDEALSHIKGNGNLEFQILYKFGYWVMRPAENDFWNKINMKRYKIKSYNSFFILM